MLEDWILDSIESTNALSLMHFERIITFFSYNFFVMCTYLTNTGPFHFPYLESLRLAEHWIKELDIQQASEHNPWRRQTSDITHNLCQDKKQSREMRKNLSLKQFKI
jgi:hypothetical protein